MRAAKHPNLTTPDLVLLSLLAERPMHGYQANLELERREIRDWANICRPQVYYSLEKLSRMGLLRATKSNAPAAGPDRRVFTTTENGRHALADALEWKEWTTQRDRPAFQTWMALSWQARPGIFERQIDQRGKFLRKELKRERATFLSICAEVGHKFHEALWMVNFAILQIQLELRWLRRLKRALPRRAAARYPQYVPPQIE
jgi:DNA-binding PadR family transcriptional regulator